MQSVSKISNLCDHNPRTSQTDGQTVRQTDGLHAISISRYAHSASRGKNILQSFTMSLLDKRTISLKSHCVYLLTTVGFISECTVSLIRVFHYPVIKFNDIRQKCRLGQKTAHGVCGYNFVYSQSFFTIFGTHTCTL